MAAWSIRMRDRLDPAWVAFMTTLAQPFEPITLPECSDPPHPFTEPIGRRGEVITFQSLYSVAGDWSPGLLDDLEFLTRDEWGTSGFWHDYPPISGFLCELPTEDDPPNDEDIRAAIKAAGPGVPLSQNFEDQQLFRDWDEVTTEGSGAHGELKQYVSDGLLWYTSLATFKVSTTNPYHPHVCIAVGRSPSGKRLVGAMTCSQLHQ